MLEPVNYKGREVFQWRWLLLHGIHLVVSLVPFVNRVICGCALGGERYQHRKRKNALTPKTFSHIAKRSGGPQALATHNMSVSPTVCWNILEKHKIWKELERYHPWIPAAFLGHVMSPGSFATHQQHSNNDVEILYILKAKSIWPMQCQCYQFSEICNLFTSYHILLLGELNAAWSIHQPE